MATWKSGASTPSPLQDPGAGDGVHPDDGVVEDEAHDVDRVAAQEPER